MVARVLIGKHPNGSYGLKVSESGYDVLTNPLDGERLIFDSDWTALNPILIRGQVYVPASPNASTFVYTSVAYGQTLSYAPFFLALWTTNPANAGTTAQTSRDWQSGGLKQPCRIPLAYDSFIQFYNLDTTTGWYVNYIVFKTQAFA